MDEGIIHPKVSRRAAIKAELLERQRVALEMKSLRRRLESLAEEKRKLTARAIAQRHLASVSTVNWIADSIMPRLSSMTLSSEK